MQDTGSICAAGLPGAYAIPGDPAGHRGCCRPEQADHSDRAGRGDAADRYVPALRDSAETGGEFRDAIPAARTDVSSRNCYCGSCAACRCSAEEKRVAEGCEAEKDRLDSEEPGMAEDPQGLSEEEQRQVEDLQQRDREVRTHEQAHVAAGARNVRYAYQTGPDGNQYAVGGSCDIDSVAFSEDHETRLAEARKMRSAALAPADPSPQDMAVAARASRLEAEAMADKADVEREELFGEDDDEQSPFSETPPMAADRYFA